GVVNEINSATPDVIVSLLPSPGQEIFLQENRDKLSAKIWYGLGRELLVPQKRGAIRKIFRHNSRTHMLKKHIIQYQKQEEAIKK
ncbi:MAG: glycosyltransferase, partial [Agathobacter sp.]